MRPDEGLWMRERKKFEKTEKKFLTKRKRYGIIYELAECGVHLVN